ncbi:uncharacterized protein LOC111287473 [Durio zibethinus]|uniref:Uncharacterized protein LOC111287473 n=1 Tax=Durio zibethinus TaxID=66656 RepID=A0A6P5Y1B9_DURZI|nr:uncharacterized protein LOC111287473 [Durio zibethinus]
MDCIKRIFMLSNQKVFTLQAIKIKSTSFTITSGDKGSLKQFKINMEKEFKMSDLAEVRYFLGMKIHQDDIETFISQRKYVLEILNIEKCKSMANEKLSKNNMASKVDASIYKSLIGSLLYLSTTKPDIMYSASLLSRFMQSPSQVHNGMAKRVLRYIRGIVDYAIW